MGYEEVETVLPADFKPQADPPEPEADPEPEQSKSSRKGRSRSRSRSKSKSSSSEDGDATGTTSGMSLLGRWRRARSRSRSKSRSRSTSAEGKSSSADKKAKGKQKTKSGSRGLRVIRTVDSDATEMQSNTTKSRLGKKLIWKKSQPEDELRQDDGGSNLPSVGLPTVREGSPSTTGTSPTDCEEGNEPTVEGGVSVEFGDENGCEVASVVQEEPAADEPEAVDAASVSGRSTGSCKSAKSNKSSRSFKKLIGKVKSPSPAPADEPNEEPAEEEEKAEGQQSAAAAADEDKEGEMPATTVEKGESKWFKKISLNIGGYKTSFQLSDPMTNLTEAVNEALTVVNDDAALADEAIALDAIGDDKAEEERDYDVNPTRLFMYIQQRAWGLAMTQLQRNPDEAKVWVYRKYTPGPAPDVKDGKDKEGAIVVQHDSLVVHDGRETPKFRWKLLPLHAAIVLGAPTEIIQDVIRAHPKAAKKMDERGSLPVHLAASRLDVDPEGEKVVLQLFGAYPDSIEVEDRKGRTPPELAKLARARKEIEEQRKLKLQDNEDAKTAEAFCATDEDDDISVKSSISARFVSMIRRAKSTDTVDRHKKKSKNKDEEGGGLSRAMSADDGPVDDATIKTEMGPGLAFHVASKTTEERERSNPAPEYQVGKGGELSDTASARGIPLPTTFDEEDDEKSGRFSPGSILRWSKSQAPVNVLEDEQATVKTVKISEEKNEVQELSPVEQDSDDDESVVRISQLGLSHVLEKAADNAGRPGTDVAEFVQRLETEWVTDVEALRRLDGQTLDRILPLMLSREVQRLINHADSIDTQYLEDDRKALRGRR